MTKQVRFEKVSPEMAAELLSRNKANRRVKEQKVAQYARDMQAATWRDSESMICLAPDGTLLNGQHRLKAVIRSGCTVEFAIAYNVDPASQESMDSGASRSYADYLHMSEGKSNATVMAALARLAINVEAGKPSDPGVSRAEMTAWLERNPDAEDAARAGDSFKRRIQAPASAIALAHWTIVSQGGGTSDQANEYLLKLAQPSNEPDESAVFAVLSRLRTAAIGSRGGGAHRNRQCASLLVKGWNYWALGKPVTSLQMTNNDKFPPKPERYSR